MKTDSIFRRTFLRKLFSSVILILLWPVRRFKAGVLALPADNPLSPEMAPPDPVVQHERNDVAVVPCGSYDPETVFTAVHEALDAIGFQTPGVSGCLSNRISLPRILPIRRPRRIRRWLMRCAGYSKLPGAPLPLVNRPHFISRAVP